MPEQMVDGEPDTDVEPTPSVVDAEGQFSESWMDLLDEDLRENDTLKRFKSLNELAKSHNNLRRTVGADTIRVPGKNAGDEEWAEVYQALGRPDAPDQYHLDKPEDVPDEFFDESRVEKAKEVYHKLGLSQKQAEALLAFDLEYEKEVDATMAKAEQQQHEEAGQALKKEWGAQYDAKLHAGNLAFEIGAEGNAALKAKVEEKYGNDPDLIRLMANIGARLEEHKIVNQDAQASESVSTIQDRIDEALHDPAYFDKKHPKHQRLVKEVTKLYQEKAKAQAQTPG